jgi:hypothetical protein
LRGHRTHRAPTSPRAEPGRRPRQVGQPAERAAGRRVAAPPPNGAPSSGALDDDRRWGLRLLEPGTDATLRTVGRRPLGRVRPGVRWESDGGRGVPEPRPVALRERQTGVRPVGTAERRCAGPTGRAPEGFGPDGDGPTTKVGQWLTSHEGGGRRRAGKHGRPMWPRRVVLLEHVNGAAWSGTSDGEGGQRARVPGHVSAIGTHRNRGESNGRALPLIRVERERTSRTRVGRFRRTHETRCRLLGRCWRYLPGWLQGNHPFRGISTPDGEALKRSGGGRSG